MFLIPLNGVPCSRAVPSDIGVNPGGWGRDPPDFGQGGRGVVGGSQGSWTGRKILVYLIMYRKYVRK